MGVNPKKYTRNGGKDARRTQTAPIRQIQPRHESAVRSRDPRTHVVSLVAARQYQCDRARSFKCFRRSERRARRNRKTTLHRARHRIFRRAQSCRHRRGVPPSRRRATAKAGSCGCSTPLESLKKICSVRAVSPSPYPPLPGRSKPSVGGRVRTIWRRTASWNSPSNNAGHCLGKDM